MRCKHKLLKKVGIDNYKCTECSMEFIVRSYDQTVKDMRVESPETKI